MVRLFWVLLSMVWSPWRKSLIIVKPQTDIKWHRNRFKHFWRLKSKSRGQGRPQIHVEIQDLIRNYVFVILSHCQRKSSISTLLQIQLLNGPLSRLWKLFLKTLYQTSRSLAALLIGRRHQPSQQTTSRLLHLEPWCGRPWGPDAEFLDSRRIERKPESRSIRQ